MQGPDKGSNTCSRALFIMWMHGGSVKQLKSKEQVVVSVDAARELTDGQVTDFPKCMEVGKILPIPPTVDAADAATFCSCPRRRNQPCRVSTAASVAWPPSSPPEDTSASTAPSSSPDCEPCASPPSCSGLPDALRQACSNARRQHCS